MKAKISREAIADEDGDGAAITTFVTNIELFIAQANNGTNIPTFTGTSTVSQAEADAVAFQAYDDAVNPGVTFLNANMPMA